MKFCMQHRKALLGLAALVSLAYAAVAVWQAVRATRDAEQRLASEAEVLFTSARLDRPAPGGFEWISAPAVFRDARRFQGRLYLCGPAGLFEYEPSGKLLARYRVGLELPPAPLVSMEVGTPPEASGPELLVATAGEGLIAFDGRGFRQIRPQEAPYRRLTAVLPLASGRILLGAEKGVLSYDGKRIAAFHPLLAGLRVTALAGDEASLWAGTLDRGVLHWHAGQIDNFGEAEGLPDPQVLSLAVHEDAAYVGTPMGVAEFRGGRFVRVLAEGFFAK